MASTADTVILASRRSRLARAQAYQAERAVIEHDPRNVTAPLWMTTTGDRQTEWSLEKQGGKGLFTKEIEEAVLSGAADLAVHSAKDLPTDMPKGLVLAAFLPRGNPSDTLVLRRGVTEPKSLATGSPRRRAQLAAIYPGVHFSEIRGNVQTRLGKIAEGEADGTVLASAGLARLEIESFEGVVFRKLDLSEMIPACGQAAIALQCRSEDRDRFKGLSHPATERAVLIERAFLRSLGGGCHTAFAGFFDGSVLHAFHEEHGRREFAVPGVIGSQNEGFGEMEKIVSEAFSDWR